MLKKLREEYLENHLLFLKKIEKVESQYFQDKIKNENNNDLNTSKISNISKTNNSINNDINDDIVLTKEKTSFKILNLWNSILSKNQIINKHDRIKNLYDQKIIDTGRKYNQLSNRQNFLASPKKITSKSQIQKNYQSIIKQNKDIENQSINQNLMFSNRKLSKHINFDKHNSLYNHSGGENEVEENNSPFKKILKYNNEYISPIKKAKTKLNSMQSSIISYKPNYSTKRSKFDELNSQIENQLATQPRDSSPQLFCNKHNHNDSSQLHITKFKARQLPNYESRDHFDIKKILNKETKEKEKSNPLDINNSSKAIDRLSIFQVYNPYEFNKNSEVNINQDLYNSRLNYEKVIKKENQKNISITTPVAIKLHEQKIKTYLDSSKFKHFKYDKMLNESRRQKLNREQNHVAFINSQFKNNHISNNNFIKHEVKNTPTFNINVNMNVGHNDISKLSMIYPVNNKTIRTKNDSFYDNIELFK